MIQTIQAQATPLFWRRKTLNLFCDELIPLLTPPPDQEIWQWADDNVWLGQDVTSQPGPWRTDFTPYLRGIMEAVKDRRNERIVVMKAARLGVTYSALNTIGYYVAHDPCPIFIVYPTESNAKKFSKKNLAPFIRDTKTVRNLVYEQKSRDSKNTILLKMFPGGSMTLVGANSPNSMRVDTAKIAIIDEADGDIAIKEGDYIKLVENRTLTYSGKGRKIIIISTPKNKGTSLIEAEYESSTMQKFHVPCPTCGLMQPIEWKRIDFETVTHRCHACDAQHKKNEWFYKWEETGKWVAENPDAEYPGFHLSALYSPFLTWETIIGEWSAAVRESKTGNQSRLQVFINTYLGETWEERGETVESHDLMNRREVYIGEVPDGVCYLTAGFDIQINRIAYKVVGHGLDGEIWVIEYGELNGSPSKGEVWNGVDEILARKWSYRNERRMMILRAAIDSGDGNVSETVYQFCRARLARGVFAVKGATTEKAPPVARSKNARDKNLIMVGVNAIKSDLMARLKITEGAGRIHFPMDIDGLPVRGVDERYFDMLTAEKRMLVRDKKGFAKYQWVLPSGKFNESWDCMVYAIAARHLLPTSHDELVKALHRKAVWELPPVTHVPVKTPTAPVKQTPKVPGAPAKRRQPALSRNAQLRQKARGL